MKPDEYGFIYPEIDYNKCISCGRCVKACQYKAPHFCSGEPKVYAAWVKDDELLKKSASGGIFAGVAKNILENGGVVFGSAIIYENGKLKVKHIEIQNVKDLYKLQGSKYVQSDIGNTYKEAKRYLEKKRKVLFSGTPCQISGLNSFLGKKYDNLLTIDIICHGVPSEQFFNDYIAEFEKRNSVKVKDFSFRDKSESSYMNSVICMKNETEEKIIFNGKVNSSYTALFLKSAISRENCYSCTFAQQKRCSDITIGDYWGFYSEHPDADKKYSISNSKGISCIIANTEKGQTYIESERKSFVLIDSSFQKAAKHNDQLNNPSKRNELREKIFEVYKEAGYEEVDRFYQINFKKYRIKETIIGFVPKRVKRFIQKFK
ncbi:MAG: Coenzyme F420 hydrogenase/dehydrogenase, beta subunit C-terminal domain [bacterium]|nr:Coenzyme F420 hydrogenase/dehydrogenase, beta subunit C-terminal domain [bacterium]